MVQRNRTIVEQLKAAVRKTGETPYAVAKRAGITPEMLSRFMHGERDIRLATAAKICAALNLELQPIDDEET